MSAETIRVGGYAPEDSTHTRALRHLATVVTQAVGDRVEIDVVPNVMDEGRPATDLLTMVESGEMTLCYFTTSYLGGRVPELDELEEPFRFDSLDDAHRALDSELGDRLGEAIQAATAFEVLGFWDNGFRHFTNAIRPVHSPADIAGMRVRLQPNQRHATMIESWGGIPVAVELSEGIRLITTGEVDAQENPLANTVAYGVDRVHPHVTMTSHLYGARAVLANRATLENMSDDIASAIRLAATEAIQLQRVIAADYELELRQRLESSGTQFVDLTEDERRAFRT